MKEEQIKQNADVYAMRVAESHIIEQRPFYVAAFNGFMSGAHSRDEEIESKEGQLKNAVSMLKDIYEDDDYFCERLLDIPEEEKICKIYCDKEGVQCNCILRYLKHYKKENNYE